MADPAVDRPPPGAGQPLTYASLFKPEHVQIQLIPQKSILYLHGEPIVQWEQIEVDQMVINENIQYAVVEKISYEWPEIEELRKLIPKYCELKGECKIGLLSNRHVLIRATLMKNYVHLLSKPAFYIMHRNKTFPMRTL